VAPTVPGGARALRHVLVIGELALSLVLMVAAGLLLRSFWDLFKVQLGFNPTRVMAIETSLPNPNDPKTDIYRTATQEAVLLREVLRRNRTIPGVEETAVSDRAAIPLGHGQSDHRAVPLIREGQEVQSSQPPLIDTSIVSPEYFHVLGMTLLRGRLFVDQDVEDTPLIAVINQAAARTYWPGKDGKGEDPVGKRVRLLGRLGRRQAGLDHHRRRHCRCTHRIARGRRHSADLPRHLPAPRQVSCVLPAWTGRSRRHLRAGAHANPGRRCGASRLPRGDLGRRSLLFAFRAAVLHGNGGAVCRTALLLAGLGIYGTISFLVNEQSREIAIRLALGAQRRNILKMVLRQGLTLAAAGAGVGLVGALIVSHLMAGLLYGVSPYDLSTFAGVTAVLTAVAIAASYVPALRAMRLDPITTLHSDAPGSASSESKACARSCADRRARRSGKG
jgi:hypothetical protein